MLVFCFVARVDDWYYPKFRTSDVKLCICCFDNFPTFERVDEETENPFGTPATKLL
jgi:hypothetical protein